MSVSAGGSTIPQLSTSRVNVEGGDAMVGGPAGLPTVAHCRYRDAGVSGANAGRVHDVAVAWLGACSAGERTSAAAAGFRPRRHKLEVGMFCSAEGGGASVPRLAAKLVKLAWPEPGIWYLARAEHRSLSLPSAEKGQCGYGREKHDAAVRFGHGDSS